MPAIRNIDELCRSGRVDLRRSAVQIVEAGLAAVDPARAVRSKVEREGDALIVDGRVYTPDRPVHLLGAGKATLAMATALEDLLGDLLEGGLVVVPQAHRTDLTRVEVIAGDHPVPGRLSAEAGSRMVEYASSVAPGSIVVCTFTGGSSALVSMAPPQISGEAKSALHELLVGSGLDVVKMNTVRKHASAVKGGRLAQTLTGCQIVNLTVSDVAGDVLDAITDPTIQDSTSRSDAVAVLTDSGLWDRVDDSIKKHLESAEAESPVLDDSAIQTVLVTNGQSATDAMVASAAAQGLRGEVVPGDWGGNASDFGRSLVARAATTDFDVVVGCGGETTVRLDSWGSAGKGGPNQELAVAAGLALDGGRDVVLVALDTDGSDGASRYAGGLVDDQTRSLWDAGGIDAAALLVSHESTVALETIGQAVLTGPTLTNVNDLFVMVMQ